MGEEHLSDEEIESYFASIGESVFLDDHFRDHVLRYKHRPIKTSENLRELISSANNSFEKDYFNISIPMHEDILKLFEEKDKHDDFASELSNRLGIMHFLRGELAKAEKSFRKALCSDELEKLVSSFGKKEEDIPKGIRNDTYARFWLSKILMLKGHLEEAREVLEPVKESNALDIAPWILETGSPRRESLGEVNAGEFHALIAMLCLKQGQNDIALNHCAQAIDFADRQHAERIDYEVEGYNPRIDLLAGSVYFDLGKMDEAGKLFNRIIERKFIKNSRFAKQIELFESTRNKVGMIESFNLSFVSEDFIFKIGPKELLESQKERLEYIHREVSKRTPIPLGVHTYPGNDRMEFLAERRSPGFNIFDRLYYSGKEQKIKMLESALDVTAEIHSRFDSSRLKKAPEYHYAKKIEHMLLDTLDVEGTLKLKMLKHSLELDRILANASKELGDSIYTDANPKNFSYIEGYCEKFDFESDLGLPCVIDLASMLGFERTNLREAELSRLIDFYAKKRAEYDPKIDPNAYSRLCKKYMGYALMQKHLATAGYRFNDLGDEDMSVSISYSCHAFYHLNAAAELSKKLMPEFTKYILEIADFAKERLAYIEKAKESFYHNRIDKILADSR